MKTLSNLHMSRRNVLKAGIAAATVPAFARFGYAADKTYTMRIAHAEGIGTPITDAFDKWAKMLNERSGGRIEAQHFPAGQLGGLPQLLEAAASAPSRRPPPAPTARRPSRPRSPRSAGRPASSTRTRRMSTASCRASSARRSPTSPARRPASSSSPMARPASATSSPSARSVLAGPQGPQDPRAASSRSGSISGPCSAPARRRCPIPSSIRRLSTGIIDALDSDFFSIIGFKWYEQAKNLTLTCHWFLPKAVRVNAAWLDTPAAGPAGAGARQRQGGLRRAARRQPRQRRRGLEELKEPRRRGPPAAARGAGQDGEADRAALRRVRLQEPRNRGDDREDPAPSKLTAAVSSASTCPETRPMPPPPGGGIAVPVARRLATRVLDRHARSRPASCLSAGRGR